MPLSRLFIHDGTNPDDLVNDGGGQHFKTSFYKLQITNYLASVTNENKVVVSLAKNAAGKDVFALQAYNSNDPLGLPQVGHFPCPDQCVPPTDKVFSEFFVSFAIGDFNQVINTYPNCILITIQIASAYMDGNGYHDSCAVFAVTYENNGEVDEKKYRGDKIFISTSK